MQNRSYGLWLNPATEKPRIFELFRDVIVLARDTGMWNRRELYRKRKTWLGLLTLRLDQRSIFFPAPAFSPRRRCTSRKSNSGRRSRVCETRFSAFGILVSADEGATACASDSKKFGAWDQNLITEWQVRYGGLGIMIYWRVEKQSVCIYSQLKSLS